MRKWEIPLLLPLMAAIINPRKQRVVQQSFFKSTCCIAAEVLVLGSTRKPNKSLGRMYTMLSNLAAAYVSLEQIFGCLARNFKRIA